MMIDVWGFRINLIVHWTWGTLSKISVMSNDGICHMTGVSVVVLFNNLIDVFLWKEIHVPSLLKLWIELIIKYFVKFLTNHVEFLTIAFFIYEYVYLFVIKNCNQILCSCVSFITIKQYIDLQFWTVKVFLGNIPVII